MQAIPTPSTVTEALDMLDAAFGHLCAEDWASLPQPVQSSALARLGQARSRWTAAHARALGAFDAADGFEGDGYGGLTPWLTGKTRITKTAAKDAAGWVKRLGGHPLISEALAAGEVSESWARQFAIWDDRLPEEHRAGADAILLTAARERLPFGQIAQLAQEIYERTAGPDDDGKDPFADRYLNLGTTFGGAGKVDGGLSPACAAALQAVLDALGKPAGPEDLRSQAQRNHDALAEAMHLLIRSGMLPGRAGGDTRAEVHIGFGDLRGMPGASALEEAWLAGKAGEPGYLTGAEAEAAFCDSSVVPLVVGHPDWQVIDRIIEVALAAYAEAKAEHGTAGETDGGVGQAAGTGDAVLAALADGLPDAPGGIPGLSPFLRPMSAEAYAALRYQVARLTLDFVSGPAGIASYLRTRLLGAPFNAASQPLDVAYSKDIPDYIRRAVTARDRHCAWPGCTRPPAACQVHHIVPRGRGGRTSVRNCCLLCEQHHQVFVHRLGWQFTMHPDGTTEARSPWGEVLRSHAPPTARAG